MSTRATFTRMEDSSAEDWARIIPGAMQMARSLPDRVMAHLKLLDGDFGDTLGSYNHADIAAAILEPFVDEGHLWMVKHHAIYQGHKFFHHIGLDRNLRDQFQGHAHDALTEEFVRLYDNPAFDPQGEMLPQAAGPW